MDAISNTLTPWRKGATRPLGWQVRARQLRKLRRMPLAEIVCRTRQEASKWIDRLSPAGRAIDSSRWLESRAPQLASPDAALQLFRDRLPGRFFAGAADPGIGSALDAHFPGARAGISRAADRLLDGRFDLLGYRDLSFGDPIDWHFDPVWSKRVPAVHWSLLDPLNPAIAGDSKIVWELNRHQWLVRLAQAWAVTRDARCAAACVNAIDEWREANPPGVGINWTSSLEVAYRLIAWCWVAVLIRHAPVTGDWAARLLTSIWQHAHHVRQYLSYYSSPNTHLTGEALGLFYAGVLFPEFRHAAEWRDVGCRVLVDESRSQILADGVHVELSTCYQRYTIETYLHFLLLARRNQVRVPEDVLDRVEAMFEFLLAVRQADGTAPAIGDADGGTLMPLVERQRSDCRGVFAVAASMFGRPELAWAADGPAPEILWMQGTDGLKRFCTLCPSPPADSGSRLFESGGYAVMRSGWDRQAHHLIVDAGPIGCAASSGHGHADLLSVQCAIFGEPCLVDAGTYCYTPEPRWRDYFRSTAAHSTMALDGDAQAQPAGPFHWHQRPRARVVNWTSDDDRDVLEAAHGAHARLADPVTLRRRAVFVKPHYWVIADEVDSSMNHDIEVAFQFAPGTHVSLEAGGWVRAETRGGRVLWMLSLSSTTMVPSVACGELNPIRGWVSADYGVRQPAPMLIYSSTATAPWRALTLLLPDTQRLPTPPAVIPIHDGQRPIGFDLAPPLRSVRL